MQFTHEHREIQKTLKRFIDEEINPHVDEWEAAEIFPRHNNPLLRVDSEAARLLGLFG